MNRIQTPQAEPKVEPLAIELNSQTWPTEIPENYLEQWQAVPNLSEQAPARSRSSRVLGRLATAAMLTLSLASTAAACRPAAPGPARGPLRTAALVVDIEGIKADYKPDGVKLTRDMITLTNNDTYGNVNFSLDVKDLGRTKLKVSNIEDKCKPDSRNNPFAASLVQATNEALKPIEDSLKDIDTVVVYTTYSCGPEDVKDSLFLEGFHVGTVAQGQGLKSIFVLKDPREAPQNPEHEFLHIRGASHAGLLVCEKLVIVDQSCRADTYGNLNAIMGLDRGKDTKAYIIVPDLKRIGAISQGDTLQMTDNREYPLVSYNSKTKGPKILFVERTPMPNDPLPNHRFYAVTIDQFGKDYIVNTYLTDGLGGPTSDIPSYLVLSTPLESKDRGGQTKAGERLFLDPNSGISAILTAKKGDTATIVLQEVR